MNSFIERIKVVGLHDSFDIDQKFDSEMNIIYGENGKFKTTLLHILANALNEEFEKFMDLKFNTISIYMNNGLIVSIGWTSPAKEKIIVSTSNKRVHIAEVNNNLEVTQAIESPLPKAAYFPTFRSTLEAWISSSTQALDHSTKKDSKKEINLFLARIFGNFIPKVDYLCLPEIIDDINYRLSEASSLVLNKDQELSAKIASNIFDIFLLKKQDSNDETRRPDIDTEILINELELILEKIRVYPIHPFLSSIKAVDKKINKLKQSLENLTEEMDYSIIQALKIYQQFLTEELCFLEEKLDELILYINSLNNFLSSKKLAISNHSKHYFDPYVRLELDLDVDDSILMNLELETEDSSYSRNHSSFPDKHQSNIKSLSSGEKQIATLLYASHISSQEVILIDEPEISLHINWQRNLLKEIVSKIKNKQIIVCTHSPVIGTNFRESIQAMNISATNPETWVYTPDVLIPKEDNEDTDGKNYKKIEDTDKEEENYEDKKYYEEEE